MFLAPVNVVDNSTTCSTTCHLACRPLHNYLWRRRKQPSLQVVILTSAAQCTLSGDRSSTGCFSVCACWTKAISMSLSAIWTDGPKQTIEISSASSMKAPNRYREPTRWTPLDMWCGTYCYIHAHNANTHARSHVRTHTPHLIVLLHVDRRHCCRVDGVRTAERIWNKQCLLNDPLLLRDRSIFCLGNGQRPRTSQT